MLPDLSDWTVQSPDLASFPYRWPGHGSGAIGPNIMALIGPSRRNASNPSDLRPSSRRGAIGVRRSRVNWNGCRSVDIGASPGRAGRIKAGVDVDRWRRPRG